MTGGVWAIRGDTADRIDHTGLVGAGVALVLAVAVPAGRGMQGGGWAVLGAAFLLLLTAWALYLVAFTYWIAGVDHEAHND